MKTAIGAAAAFKSTPRKAQQQAQHDFAGVTAGTGLTELEARVAETFRVAAVAGVDGAGAASTPGFTFGDEHNLGITLTIHDQN